MTLFEAIKQYDIDTMAAHMYSLIAGTEERLLANLSALGIDATLCTLSEDVRIAQLKQDLLQEVD
jgi:hypothetical protein